MASPPSKKRPGPPPPPVVKPSPPSPGAPKPPQSKPDAGGSAIRATGATPDRPPAGASAPAADLARESAPRAPPLPRGLVDDEEETTDSFDKLGDLDGPTEMVANAQELLAQALALAAGEEEGGTPPKPDPAAAPAKAPPKPSAPTSAATAAPERARTATLPGAGPAAPTLAPPRSGSTGRGKAKDAGSSPKPPPSGSSPKPASSAGAGAPSGAAPDAAAKARAAKRAADDSRTIRNDSMPVTEGSSSRPPVPLSAIAKFGRYEVLGRLAFGGMAEIFLARETLDRGAARYLVIKRILAHVADDDEFVHMFLDEARLAMQLNHPNICHIYEFGQQDDSYFIAMEWVNGVPLGKLLRRARQEGGVPAHIAAWMIGQIAQALHHAHRARDAMGNPLGIVHRDVTPHNIMVSYDGNVKLLDFGIAKAISQNNKTQAGVVKGKFAYMSPQQCLAQNIDHRTDIFALGVCLYETLTGQPLYHRQTEYETMRAVIEDPVPSIRDANPNLPEALDKIVQKALAKKAEDRYQTAAEMQDAIEVWLAENRFVVNSSRMSALMERLYGEEIRRGPLVDSMPFGQSFVARSPRGDPSALMDVDVEVEPPVKKRPRWVASLVVIGIAAAIGGVAATQLGTEEPDRVSPPPPIAVPERPGEQGASGTETQAGGDPSGEEVPGQPAAPGRLVVRTTPSGATVELGDRQLEGRTPIEIGDIEPGEYAVTINRPGFAPWTGTITIAPGETATVEETLERGRPRPPAAPPGTLSLNTRPWSKVYVGNRMIGTTPIGGARVPSGQLRLRLVDRDGNTHHKVVVVRPGEEARAFFDLSGG